MKNLTATDARKGFFDLVSGATERHEIYHIHHRKGDVVLLSKDGYDALLESIELLSSKKLHDDFTVSQKQAEAGETVGFDEVFGELQ